MYMCSRRDVITVECLDGITGYASTEGPKLVGVIDQ